MKTYFQLQFGVDSRFLKKKIPWYVYLLIKIISKKAGFLMQILIRIWVSIGYKHRWLGMYILIMQIYINKCPYITEGFNRVKTRWFEKVGK